MVEKDDAVTVRAVHRRDAAALRDIHNHFVDHSTATFDLVHRTIDEQAQWIHAHSGSHPAIVAELDGHIVGFGSLSTFRDRPAYSTTVEDSVYLLDGFQRRGIGRLLLCDLAERAQAHGFHSIIARIVGGNEASIRLHAACGFEIVGTERQVGRKFGKWLDVVEMQRML